MEKNEKNKKTEDIKNTEDMSNKFTMSDIENDISDQTGNTVNDSEKASGEKIDGSGRTFSEAMMQRVMIPTVVLILALLIGIPSLLYSTIHVLKEITGVGRPQFEQGRDFRGPGENGNRYDSRGSAPDSSGRHGGSSDNSTSDGAMNDKRIPNNDDSSNENDDSNGDSINIRIKKNNEKMIENVGT